MANIKISSFESALYTRSQSARSAWERGVARYALDIISDLQDRGIKEINPHSPHFLAQCLNGAKDWKQYSEGGCSLISDYDIAHRLCSPSELKRIGNPCGKRPNRVESSWIETQARALWQAFRMICDCASTHARKADATK